MSALGSWPTLEVTESLRCRRHLLGLGTLPPYATWGSARQLAQAGLVGKWDGTNEADKAAIGELLGKDYGEWIETPEG